MSVLRRIKSALERQGRVVLTEEKKFYLVREDILPESILKTALAKDMLSKGEAENILDAVDKLGMSRSTFYKYKDGIFSFFNADNLNIINISLLLKNKPGVLSLVLNHIAEMRGNILTINQNLPLHGVALVTISISLEAMSVSPDQMLKTLRHLEGVVNVEIVGKT